VKKAFQAKHIDDKAVIKVMVILCEKNQRRSPDNPYYAVCNRWEVVEAFAPIPWKLIQAKLTALHRKWLVADGCVGCTCSTGFKVGDAGMALLEQPPE